MDRALIIKQPWVDLILSGEKRWEMRSRPTNIRGRIGIIEQGTGLIVGECNLIGVLDPIVGDGQRWGKHLHRISDPDLLKKWRYPWELSGAFRYKTPIPYKHPRGAVTWVKI